DQLQTLNNRRIATSHPQILSQFLKANEIQAQLVNLSGSVELAPRMNLADLVCDLVSTGNTAKLNGLTQMRTIFKSQAVLVSKNKFSSIESELKEEFLLRVQAAISAQKLKYLMMNIPQTEKSFFVKMLPAARSPTILPLSDERYAALQVVLSEDEVWKIFPSLKRMGATDIILTEVVGYLK
ncbi:MAG: ATP phosphoribosyltransferase, partial [Pseudobdellovibrionaceae bacterium]